MKNTTRGVSRMTNPSVVKSYNRPTRAEWVILGTDFCMGRETIWRYKFVGTGAEEEEEG